MIESRAKRRSTLLHRRKIAIIVFAIVFAVLLSTVLILYNYFNSVFKFRDYDETIYYVKVVDGEFGMYDENGKELPKSTPPGSLETFYITKCGTWVDVDSATGDTKIRAIPDLHYMSDGEELDQADLIIVFPSVETDDIKTIEVTNPYGSYSIDGLIDDAGKKYFVLGESPFIATDDNAISYITYYTTHVTANERLDNASKDLSEYGLIPELRTRNDGTVYEYTPSYYTVTTEKGEKHKIIIGDSLVDGSGYYIQYENAKGTVRPAVYVLKPADVSAVSPLMTYESTVMGPAKNYLTPALLFAQSGNTYYEVENFSVSIKDDNNEYEQLIDFSYVNLDDRTGTIQGSHPYVFNETSFTSYKPNHDNIDAMIQMLIEPDIVDIAAINPTNEEKVQFGIMSIKVDEKGDPILDEYGNKQFYYDSEHVLKFDRYITLTSTDENGKEKEEKFKITQRIYISEMNSNGNYYTYTLITMPEATDKGMVESININAINEVSQSTFSFLKWTPYNWVYQPFMQIGIKYVEQIELLYGDYYANFVMDHGKVGKLTTLGIKSESNKGEKLNTFSLLEFDDREGYHWVVTPQRVYVYDAKGNEVKVEAIHFDYNSIGEQVHVMEGYRTDVGGNKVYITKDKIIIVYANGKAEEVVRYYTTIFKKVFTNIISMKLIDSYVVSDEKIAEIVKKDNHILTIKIHDNEGNVQTCEFYNITGRKAYVVVDGQGGFYVHTAKLTKLMNDVARFFAGEDVDMDAIS